MREELGRYSHSVTKSQTRLKQLCVCMYILYIYICVCVCVYIYMYVCMYVCIHGLPWWHGGKGSTWEDPRGSGYLGQKDPLEKEMEAYSSLLV